MIGWRRKPSCSSKSRLCLVGGLIVAALSTDSPSFGSAGESEAAETAPIPQTVPENPVEMGAVFEDLTVVGGEKDVRKIPGSAHFIGKEQLDEHQYLDIHRVLQSVPGVNIQEEDGWGRRPNIGMRGTGSERSSKITVLEDGVLAAPAPYAAPAAYYFPVAARMEAVEVLKGSSSIRQGPYTNGGVLNLISSSIPGGDLSGRVTAAAGQDSLLKGRAVVGGSKSRFGWLAETYQFETDGFKNLDGGGNTGFDLGDYLLKFRLNSGSNASIAQTFDVKLGYTEEFSNETYLGLTDDDFESTPFRRYAASQQDTLDTEHTQFQARYFVMPSPSISITATAYRNDFFRNWDKLQSVLGVGLSDVLEDPGANEAEMEIIRGLSDSDPGDVKLRNNRRDYLAQGLEAVLGLDRFFRHDIEIGVRYHQDQEDRFQEEDSFQMLDGFLVFNESGAPGSQSNRIDQAKALAFFAQDQIFLDRWTISPGIRFEGIDYRRDDFGKSDPDRTGTDLDREYSDVDAWIPGLGVTYQPHSDMTVFGGIHKGFSPPGPGRDEDTRPEESINYELGWRYWTNSAQIEVVGFFNDYENLLGRDSLASGGSGDGELFNGGAAAVRGVELSASADPGRRRGWRFGVPIRISYTYTHGEFESSFESSYDPWKPSVEAGDELPYMPAHQAAAGVGLSAKKWNAALGLGYVSEMRTNAGVGPIPPTEGTDARVVIDLSAQYLLPRGLRLFVQVRNLSDETYIAARRPAGIRPGLPRTLIVGAGWDF